MGALRQAKPVQIPNRIINFFAQKVCHNNELAPELIELIHFWPKLSKKLKKSIMLQIKAGK
jgi:hypothetical protein